MESEQEFSDLLEQLPRVAEQMEALVEEWSAREFTGAADDGRVVATVNAVGALLRIDIHVLSKRRLDNVSLAEAAVSAVHAAEAAAAEAKAEMMHALRIGNRPSLGEMIGETQRIVERGAGFTI